MEQEYRPEGEKWFEWPLTLVAPARFGEVIIDREAGCLRAKCAWKAKDPSQMGAEPSNYVKEA